MGRTSVPGSGVGEGTSVAVGGGGDAVNVGVAGTGDDVNVGKTAITVGLGAEEQPANKTSRMSDKRQRFMQHLHFPLNDGVDSGSFVFQRCCAQE